MQGGDEGEEGLMVLLQNEIMSTVGEHGQGMGLEGIISSFVIVFDTNKNPSNLTP